MPLGLTEADRHVSDDIGLDRKPAQKVGRALYQHCLSTKSGNVEGKAVRSDTKAGAAG